MAGQNAQADLWTAAFHGDVGAALDALVKGAVPDFEPRPERRGSSTFDDEASNWRLSKDDTPLHAAAKKGHTDVIRALLQTSVSPDIETTFTQGTALSYAARCGHKDATVVLLDAGANPTKGLPCCVEGDILELLYQRGADPTSPEAQRPDEYGVVKPPLLYAITSRNAEAVCLALKSGAPPTYQVPGHRGVIETPLYTATRNHKRIDFPGAVAGCAIVRLLLDAGAAIPAPQPSAGSRAPTAADMLAAFAGAGNDQELAEALIASCGGARAPVKGRVGGATLIDTLLLESMSERPALPFVQLCLGLGASANAAGRDGSPPLMLLGRDSRHASAEDGSISPDDHAALAVARSAEIAEIARVLLEAKADVHFRAPESYDEGHCAPGRTPLHAACERGIDGLVQVLLTQGADVSAEDDDGSSPILMAARSRRSGVLALLLPSGALRNEKHVVSVLRACAGTGDAASFLTVLAMAPPAAQPRPMLEFIEGAITGAKRTETARKRVRETHEGDSAAAGGRRISLGGDGGEEDEDSPYAQIVAACLRHGASAKAALPGTGASAVLSAAEAGAKGLLTAFLAAGADATVTDPETSDTLLLKVLHGGSRGGRVLLSDLEAVLASAGAAHVNAANKAGLYPLGLAALLSGRSAVRVARHLLAAGADPNFSPPVASPGCSVYGRPLFMLARITDAGEAAAELCRALLEAGADPSARDSAGQTVLMRCAGRQGLFDVFTVLLEDPRTDMHAADPEGMTALHFACLYSRVNATATRTAAAAAPTRYVEALLARGADASCRNGAGSTPLHLAASRRAEGVEIAAALLRSGADANAADLAGRVPLTETLPALDPSPDHSRRFSLAAVRTLVAGGARLDTPAAGDDLALMRGLMKEFSMFTEEEEAELVALIEQHDAESLVHLREVINETRVMEENREHRMRQVLNKMLNLRVASAFAAWKQFRKDDSDAERALEAVLSHHEGEELSAVPEDSSVHDGAAIPADAPFEPPPPPPLPAPPGAAAAPAPPRPPMTPPPGKAVDPKRKAYLDSAGIQRILEKGLLELLTASPRPADPHEFLAEFFLRERAALQEQGRQR